MLDAFSELKLSLEENSEKCPEFKSATFDLTTREGIDKDTYDFNLSMDDWLGFEAKDLRLVGTAQFDGDRESAFQVPVDLLKLEAEFVAEDNEEVLQINPKA